MIISKMINIPLIILLKLDRKGIVRLNDNMYIKLMYKKRMNKKLDINNPKTFNEKLQWLKVFDRNQKYTKMVDKFEAKEYVSNIIGNEYIIPTLGVWERFEDIEFNKLPNKFVLKCTHNSGGVIIVKDKNSFDQKKAKKYLNDCLKVNYYYYGREWPYKNVNPQIIAEKFMENINEEGLKDYKIFCFNGCAKIILVCSNRKEKYKNTDFFDTQWKKIPFTRKNHTNNPKGIEKPKNLKEMLEVAEKVSKDIPFVRVDLYEINNKVYFGELTLYPSSGFEGFEPDEYDIILGEMIKLPEKN